MKYSSYEVLVNHHPVTILNNHYHIKRLIYKTNKFVVDYYINIRIIIM